MLKKLANTTESVNFDVIVGGESEVTGNIVSQGSVRVDGKVTGDIISQGNIIIGSEAKVSGNVKGANIEISGYIVGDVESTGLLKIYETGLLDGNIEVMSFIIEEGGSFRGNCDINTKGLGDRPKPENSNEDDPKNNQDKNRDNRRNKNNREESTEKTA